MISGDATGAPPRAPGKGRYNSFRIIGGASLGALFEWYDFYVYGALASVLGHVFFPPIDESFAFFASLAAFGAGFAVRPFGALVFGWLGDFIGRKYAFLLTILVMGSSTALVGLLPTYEQIGLAAPILLIILRLAQGLALGGEYGGAAIFVAEHAPANRRGLHTSWIQTTATLGFGLSLIVVLICRASLSPTEFLEWGWRLPFIASILLLGLSVYIRVRLHESPLFTELKARGQTSKQPITDSLLRWRNLRWMLLALFGATAGQAVIWYAGQFYVLFFLQSTLKVPHDTATLLVAAGLLLGTPFVVLFGYLSDLIGRKPIMIAGCLIAAVSLIPVFKGLTLATNPALVRASQAAPISVSGSDCSAMLWRSEATICDLVRAQLSRGGIPYEWETSPGQPLSVKIAGQGIPVDETLLGLTMALRTAGYPERADPAHINFPLAIGLLTVLMTFVAMVYGPIAAFLVELFPTRVRFTSLSLPYHLGNGWFGGMLPVIAFGMVLETGNIYAGLWYPIIVAAASAIIGFFFLNETYNRNLMRVTHPVGNALSPASSSDT